VAAKATPQLAASWEVGDVTMKNGGKVMKCWENGGKMMGK